MRDPIIGYLKTVSEFLVQHAPDSTAAFCLRHGACWQYAPLPERYAPGVASACFMNAAKLAMRQPELTYVEGYASGVFPTEHAWCVDAAGRVIDTTWHDLEVPAERHYFGIPFKTRFLRRFLLERRRYGLLVAYEADFPIQTGKYPEAEWLDAGRLKAGRKAPAN